MTVLTQTYANGVTRTLTVVSVQTSEPDAAVLMTGEDGAVVITADGTPDLFSQAQAAGILTA